MPRIRSIKPEFFKNFKLFKAEQETSLPLRLSFAGLWTACDREGRFKWSPEELKLDCLPHDQIDFSCVLDALATRGYIVKYSTNNEYFGFIPTWKIHQSINNREAASFLPTPDVSLIINQNKPNDSTRESRVPDASNIQHAVKNDESNLTDSISDNSTCEPHVNYASLQLPRGKERKGKERKGKEEKDASLLKNLKSDEISFSEKIEIIKKLKNEPDIKAEFYNDLIELEKQIIEKEKISGQKENIDPNDLKKSEYLSFEEIQSRLTGQIWQDGVCSSQRFDKDDFKKFTESWIDKKRITGDFNYPMPKLRLYLINDYELHIKNAKNGAKRKLTGNLPTSEGPGKL